MQATEGKIGLTIDIKIRLDEEDWGVKPGKDSFYQLVRGQNQSV